MMVSFTHVMEAEIHEGEKLKELILSITTIEKLAKRIGKHRNTLGNWFDMPKVDLENLILVGKGLRYDMTSKFPRLKSNRLGDDLHYFNEDPAEYLKDISLVKDQLKKKDQAIADSHLEIQMLRDKIQDLQSIISDKNDIIERFNELIAAKDKIIEMCERELDQVKSTQETG